jgi:hypothetical protein
LIAGASLTVAGLLALAWSIYGPRRSKPERVEMTPMFQASASPTITPSLPRAEVTQAPTVTPIHNPWLYDGVDMSGGGEVVTALDGLALLEPFRPHIWTPDALGGGIFDLGAGTALAWLDDAGRVGLWLHSGLDQTASPLQEYVERDARGYLRTVAEAESVLDGLLGREVLMMQAGRSSRSQIAAVVRIAPDEVDRLSTHVGDMVEYLAYNYPESGFGVLPREDVLTLFFCGLRLGGEEKNPNVSYWRQARFIIALTPVEDAT